jgi:hypothetical protein
MYLLNLIETNPLIIGISGLINSIGVRLIWDDLDINDREWLYYSNFKKIVIFTIIFITTKNFLISIIIFLLYIIIFQPDYLNSYMNLNINNKMYNQHNIFN